MLPDTTIINRRFCGNPIQRGVGAKINVVFRTSNRSTRLETHCFGCDPREVLAVRGFEKCKELILSDRCEAIDVALMPAALVSDAEQNCSGVFKWRGNRVVLSTKQLAYGWVFDLRSENRLAQIPELLWLVSVFNVVFRKLTTLGGAAEILEKLRGTS